MCKPQHALVAPADKERRISDPHASHLQLWGSSPKPIIPNPDLLAAADTNAMMWQKSDMHEHQITWCKAWTAAHSEGAQKLQLGEPPLR
jgi:hypothetical protein